MSYCQMPLFNGFFASSIWVDVGTSGIWTLNSAGNIATWVSGGGVSSIAGPIGRNSASAGKRYFELCRVVTGLFGILVRDDCGLTRNGSPTSVSGDTNSNGYVYRRGGEIVANGANIVAAPEYFAGDVINIAVDFDAQNIWFGVNGVYVAGNPTTGTGAPISSITPGTYYPGASQENPSPLQCRLASYPNEFTFAPPSGFMAWGI